MFGWSVKDAEYVMASPIGYSSPLARHQCAFDAGGLEPGPVRQRRGSRRSHGRPGLEKPAHAARLQPQPRRRAGRGWAVDAEADMRKREFVFGMMG